MQLPIYKEIYIEKVDKNIIKRLVLSQPLGKAPLVFKVSHLENEESKAISLIEEVLRESMISCLFPYPIFALSTMSGYKGEIKIISDLKNLPRYFDRKETKINVKGQSTLNKVKILQKKIYNSNVSDQIQKTKNFASKHKILFNLAQEGDFLEKLLSKVR